MERGGEIRSHGRQLRVEAGDLKGEYGVPVIVGQKEHQVIQSEDCVVGVKVFKMASWEMAVSLQNIVTNTEVLG